MDMDLSDRPRTSKNKRNGNEDLDEVVDEETYSDFYDNYFDAEDGDDDIFS
jgi:hypothetical protein